ncbi:MAG: thioredoxin-dependent thiol peroxidase [Bacteroidetes bacterium]|nr:thioredoxin-dependent thiol peroxidase [Bacteroidota bacterium]
MKLNIGDTAPDFQGRDQNGDIIRLSDYRGKKIILYFYPKDNTPGCTTQACNLSDNIDSLNQHGYEVIGVSADNEKSHKKFIDKYNLPFPLIADTDKKIIGLYDVWQEKSMYGRKYWGTVRTTFIIDKDGKIEKIIDKVKTNYHAGQIVT